MTDVALIGPVAAPDLHVMSFNIRRRFPFLRPGSPDRWSTRKPVLQRILAAEQPTLLGVQEALADQAAFVADALGPRYRWVGRGRNANGSGERCAIYYDAERLELADWVQLALSSTPDRPGSRSWGNSSPRVLVSAAFTDLATGARLLAYNTHFDHLSRRSKSESARMIAQLAATAQRDEPGVAMVVTGDFNVDVSSAVHDRLTAGGILRDTWEVAEDRLTPQWGTFPNYRRRRPGGRRIDLVLVGPGVDVLSAGINAARLDGAAASDHEPVQAVIRPREGARDDGLLD